MALVGDWVEFGSRVDASPSDLCDLCFIVELRTHENTSQKIAFDNFAEIFAAQLQRATLVDGGSIQCDTKSPRFQP